MPSGSATAGMHQAPDRGSKNNVRVIPIIPRDNVKPREVAVRRCSGIVLIVKAKESPSATPSGTQVRGERLNRGTR
jgi:hypothetical protein